MSGVREGLRRMSSGAVMWGVLIVFLVIWGAVDFYIWHAWDGETATRWFVKVSKKHKGAAWFALLLIVSGAVALLLHLEVFERL